MTDRKYIVFFDGHCNLCNGFVNFLLKKDKHGRLAFSPLQGEKAVKILGDVMPESVLFQDGGRVYAESEAVLRICTLLEAPWKYAVVFRIIPASLRNRIYRFIAARRYRIFGRREACRLPDVGPDSRFL